MSDRKQRKALGRWEDQTRTWATDTGRELVLALYHSKPIPVRPYNTGVVLLQGEKAWAETQARCSLDVPEVGYAPRRGEPPARPPITRWLATNHRLVGRLSDGALRGWGWSVVMGCRISLDPGSEWMQIDVDGEPPVVWTGPGIAPLAVVAVWHLHGPRAVIEHPGLAPLRQTLTDDLAKRAASLGFQNLGGSGA